MGTTFRNPNFTSISTAQDLEMGILVNITSTFIFTSFKSCHPKKKKKKSCVNHAHLFLHFQLFEKVLIYKNFVLMMQTHLLLLILTVSTVIRPNVIVVFEILHHFVIRNKKKVKNVK